MNAEELRQVAIEEIQSLLTVGATDEIADAVESATGSYEELKQALKIAWRKIPMETRIIASLNGTARCGFLDPNSALEDAVRSNLEFKNKVLADYAAQYRAAIDSGAKYPDIEELWDKIEAGMLKPDENDVA